MLSVGVLRVLIVGHPTLALVLDCAKANAANGAAKIIDVRITMAPLVLF